MYLTGTTNSIQVPQVPTYGFAVTDIVFGSYQQASFYITDTNGSSQDLLIFKSGIISLTDSRRIGTYNTGEGFNISGFKTIENNQDKYRIYLNDILVEFSGINTITNVQKFNFNLSVGGTVGFNFDVYGVPFNYGLNMPSFVAGSSFDVPVTSDYSFWTYGSDFSFYNSYEQNLSGCPIIAFWDTGNPLSLTLTDTDTNPTDGPVVFRVDLDTPFPSPAFNVTGLRTGMFSQTTDIITGDVNATLSSLWYGVWSGNTFVPQDASTASTFISFNQSRTSGNGAFQTGYAALTCSMISPFNTYYAFYPQTFALTNSGEYLQPPTLKFTGYYCVTGIQQALTSLLFSSGCTGALPVTFSGTRIAAASGQLNLTPIYLQNVYGAGTQQFYVPSSYTVLNSGNGYNAAPLASVLTGKYPNCYDVPAHFGNNVAWFMPFNTVGALSPQATYLTGEVLCATGLVSGGALTGYLVTGINLTNNGSGFLAGTYPLALSFIRQTGDTLTNNASGTMTFRSDFVPYNFFDQWQFSYSLNGSEYVPVPKINYATLQTGISLPAQQNTVSVKATLTGAYSQTPFVARVTLGIPGGAGISTLVTGNKYFNADPYALKKNFNVPLNSGTFLPTAELTFDLTQDQIDSLYSTSAYLNNDWGIVIGDLDF